MPLNITKGLGSLGGGSVAQLLSTQGYGSPGLGVCVGLVALGVVAFESYVLVNFNKDIQISGPAASPSNYNISKSGPGDPVNVLGVSISSAQQLRLDTTVHTPGTNYTLNMPHMGLLATDLGTFEGPFALPYVGVAGVPVIVQIMKVIDARTIEIVFNRAVNEQDASNPSNYTITLDEGVGAVLTVSKATKITDFNYRLTTSRQVQGTVYEVVISNIRPA